MASSSSIAALSFLGTVFIVRNVLKKQKHSSNDDAYNHSSPIPSPSQTLSLIQTRRSIFTKQFTGESVPRPIIDDMLEAARWAPNHHITEPWRFVVFESQEGRESVGKLLQQLYTSACTPAKFSQAKYDKKLRGAKMSSHLIAICVGTDTKNPFVEEVSTVAMAVQNMHLMATAHGVGAYWSSGGVHRVKKEGSSADDADVTNAALNLGVMNPKELTQFLGETLGNDEPFLCLGWMYIGDYHGSSDKEKKKWPTGRRGPIDDKVVWR